MNIDRKRFMVLAQLIAAPLITACGVVDDLEMEIETLAEGTTMADESETDAETSTTMGPDTEESGSTGPDTEGSGSTGPDTEGAGTTTEGSGGSTGTTGTTTEGAGTGSTGGPSGE